jgi:predicted ArsR family transcriptional regulator
MQSGFTKLEDEMTIAKRNRTLAALESLGRPAASKELSLLTDLTEQSAYRHMCRLVAENKAYVAYTQTPAHGGRPENFYLSGPAPAGHKAALKEASEEERKARAEIRKAKRRASSRNSKQRRREAAAAALTEQELFTPNRRYCPTSLSEPFEQLEGVWHSILKGENHAHSV